MPGLVLFLVKREIFIPLFRKKLDSKIKIEKIFCKFLWKKQYMSHDEQMKVAHLADSGFINEFERKVIRLFLEIRSLSV